MATKRSGLGARRGAVATALAVSEGAQETVTSEVLPSQTSRPIKFLPQENFEDSINRLLGEAHERYRLVGERLLEWREATPHGEFMRLITDRIEAGALNLPNYQAANRFMVIAEAIRDGRVAEEALPKEDGTAYLIASLRPDEISVAREEGLVRPTVKKAELTAFRKRLRSPTLPAPSVEVAEIEAELKQVIAEESRLARRRRQLEEALAKLTTLP